MAKKMTNAEKRRNAAVKKELQEEGILPADKPRLNRKKYIEEARKEWDNRNPECYIWDYYLQQAIGIMLVMKDHKLRISPEAIGVAKCLKLAIRLEAFPKQLKEEGKSTYSIKDQYEYIKDILDA